MRVFVCFCLIMRVTGYVCVCLYTDAYACVCSSVCLRKCTVVYVLIPILYHKCSSIMFTRAQGEGGGWNKYVFVYTCTCILMCLFIVVHALKSVIMIVFDLMHLNEAKHD